MKVLITGATGLVGTKLVSLLLQNNYSVHYLTTNKKEIQSEPNYQGFFWDPQKGNIDEAAISGVDAIIHLAGASISNRWTAKHKQAIIESRTLTTNLLYRTLKSGNHQVRQFISASAIGIYPNSLTNFYSEEEKSVDNSFLGNVVVKWEQSVDNFKRLNIKVCKIRTGLVLAEKGGMLQELVKPIKLGFGSPFGSGKQWQSWIHIDDLVHIYLFALKNNLQGVYNAVAPNPVTNKQLTHDVAKTLNKPFFMPAIPTFVLKLMLGEMHILLVSSQKVSSKKIEENGFQFKFPKLQPALENLLK